MLTSGLIFEGENKDDLVNIETFSKLLEWFGPLGNSMLERVKNIVSKKYDFNILGSVLSVGFMAICLIFRQKNGFKGIPKQRREHF